MLSIWSLLVVLAIYDLKENRIPNKLLVLLLLVITIYKISHYEEYCLYIYHGFIGFLVMFILSLSLYLFKVFAAGDVKLLACVGYLVGWGHLSETSFYMLISSGLVASLFALLSMAGRPELVKIKTSEYMTNYFLSQSLAKPKTLGTTNKLRMPLAPSVVIGLTLSSYF